MKKLLVLIIFFCSSSFLFSQNKKIVADVPLIQYELLRDKIKENKDVLLILNFWSTTCAPCVKELPDFIEINNKFSDKKNFKMLLVSLDRAKDKEKVIKFIENKNLTAEVVILDDIKRMNTWIPAFEERWEGNIPVTIIYKNSEKIHFNDGEMSKQALENIIEKNLN
ncbi:MULTISPECIES: TlpA family protein disulfide reductase [Chryseobacterium]|uniref:Cytochrome c biogenesis protein tlpA n=1 Tax=Chryseobacterium taihuense TaxID=1141221 RepID=A0A4V6IDP9_9FLAO|nr:MULTISPECIES: TlpA disulfide reductase family protein [Chryseobacterium]QQV02395.1 TlpA family protein disulfide reductase [Chryseobacterium sp. FDAARGOS 1104]VFB04354.1 Cytochrome c biogenesis protein tlpA [Chryseobacterium taihuense]